MRRLRTRLAALAFVSLAITGCGAEAGSGAPQRVSPAPVPAPVGAPAAADGVRAIVTRVADGDSLVVQFPDGSSGDVRLQGIDAPEAHQAWGREAGDHLRRLALGAEVELRLRGRDGYGRHVGLAVGERGDLGLLQLRSGHAWYYRRYAGEQEPEARARYAAAERAARQQRLGLWSAATPIAPWDFKASRRAAPAGPFDGAPDMAGRIVGNRKSRLYHLPGCPGHPAVSPSNAVPFETEEAARAAGFRRAANC